MFFWFQNLLNNISFVTSFHHSFQRSFEQKSLSIIFSKAILIGNGLIAIISGLVGNLLVYTFEFGPVAPFDAAGWLLAIGMAIIMATWTENYGDPSENKSLISQFTSAATIIASGASLALILIFLLQYQPLFLSLYDSKSRRTLSFDDEQMRKSLCSVPYSPFSKVQCTFSSSYGLRL